MLTLYERTRERIQVYDKYSLRPVITCAVVVQIVFCKKILNRLKTHQIRPEFPISNSDLLASSPTSPPSAIRRSGRARPEAPPSSSSPGGASILELALGRLHPRARPPVGVALLRCGGQPDPADGGLKHRCEAGEQGRDAPVPALASTPRSRP
jgi:hypothetical protein